MELKKKENIGWIDLLRVLACFFVVFSHSCDAFIGQFDANRESFLTGVFWGSLMRPCVPIFVMMTEMCIRDRISTSTPLGNSNFIRASTVLAVEL